MGGTSPSSNTTPTTIATGTTPVTNGTLGTLDTTLLANGSYTLTLTSKDDNSPGDPTYTKYDDVATS